MKQSDWLKMCQCQHQKGHPLTNPGRKMVRSTLSSYCPLSSNQHRWFTLATSISFPLKKWWECRESNLGHVDDKQVCYLQHWTVFSPWLKVPERDGSDQGTVPVVAKTNGASCSLNEGSATVSLPFHYRQKTVHFKPTNSEGTAKKR